MKNNLFKFFALCSALMLASCGDPSVTPTEKPTEKPTEAPFVAPESISIIGSWGTHNWDHDLDLETKDEGHNWVTKADVTFLAGNQWKLRQNHAWNGSEGGADWGYSSLSVGAELAKEENGNISILADGMYKVEFNYDTSAIALTRTGDYVPEEIVPSHTKIVYTNDIQTIKGGSDLKDAKQQEPFKALFNDDTPNLLTSYESAGVFVQEAKNEKLEARNVLTMGSSSANGSLTLHFGKKITELTINAQTYIKYFPKGEEISCSKDNDGELKVSTSEGNSSMKILAAATEITIETFKFNTPVTEITIENVGTSKNRVFIESLTFDWLSE